MDSTQEKLFRHALSGIIAAQGTLVLMLAKLAPDGASTDSAIKLSDQLQTLALELIKEYE